MVAIATSNENVDVTISAAVSKGPVSWWMHPAPRLQASDSDEHIVITTNFGLGVDMSVYLLSSARMVMDDLTSEERDNYLYGKGFV